MKWYTIIAGVNGVGKSSLSGVLKTQLKDLGQIVDVDKIAATRDVSSLEAGKAAVAIMQSCMDKGVNFSQETTLSGKRVERTVSLAKSLDYSIRMFYIGLDSAEESIARIKNRVARGGHNISDGDVYRRFASRWDSLLQVLPYCDEAHFYDNDNGFVEVAEYQNGELVPKGDYCPRWLQELKGYEKASSLPEQEEQGELEL